MRLKGVSYDVGRVLGMNWRPGFGPDVVHRELEIIKTDPEPWRHDRRQRNAYEHDWPTMLRFIKSH